MFSSRYKVSFNEIRDFILRTGAKKVLVQAPDGLKTLYGDIEEYLRGLDVEPVFSGNPFYGSCMISVEEIRSIGADAVIHIGHNRYPYLRSEPPAPVLYIPAYYIEDALPSVLGEITSILREKDLSRIGVAASIQHVHRIEYLREELEKKGYTVYIGSPASPHMLPGQVLGCDYTAMLSIRDRVDGYIVVAGGEFHALGACLATQGRKTVIHADPYRGEARDYTSTCTKIIAKRIYLVSTLINKYPHKAAIVTSPYLGQHRPRLIQVLREKLSAKNIETRIYSAHLVGTDVLAAIDNEYSPDVFIVTSCPRLPIDDLAGYHKPVITPGEAVMLAEETLDPYIYPW